MISNKIKIVHISTYENGGAGRAAFRLHNALLKIGLDSTFICLDNLYLDEEKSEAQFSKPFSSVSFWNRQKNRIKFRIKKHFGISLYKKEERIINEIQEIYPKLDCEIATIPLSKNSILENQIVQNADIINLHWVGRYFDYQKFFGNNIKPVVWTMHDMNAFKGIFHYAEDEERNRKLVKKLDKKITSLKAKAILNRKSELSIVSPSKWLLNECLKSKTFEKTSACSIPYALDTSIFSPNGDNLFKNKLNIPEENTVFLFVADYIRNRRKGLMLLIEAINKIKHLPITLLLLGNAQDLSVEKIDVRKLGNIKNNDMLAYYYSNVDAFILPSREDNLPNVMLESLACGTPVIGFSVGGIKEHVFNFRTGLLAQNLDSSSLATVIENFCENKARFDSEKIRDYAKETFDEQKIAENYLDIYNKLVNKN